ncbi:MAG TPA: zf-HC2 domain-containing protein [Thermoanaerobaculia bacterium]|nr:zf-HC2 domain-containing protein [Thermoanaerobaculia bacterium]
MHSDCPSNQNLAAFIDGRLDSRTRASVVKHLSSCVECSAFVSDAIAIRAAVGDAAFEPRGFAQQESTMPRGNLLPFRALAAAAAIAAGVAAVLFVPAVRESVPGLRSPGSEELAKVAHGKRVTDARIAALSAWGEPPQTLRGGGDETSDYGNDENSELLTKTATIQEAVDAHPTRRNLRNLGIARLLRKEPQLAIDALERARALGPADAALLNDLAAAYTERRQRTGAKTDDEKALAYAEQAWQLGKTPAAAWNRALALQSLEKNAEAKAAWAQYLTIEKDLAWRKEAQQRLDDLNELTALR